MKLVIISVELIQSTKGRQVLGVAVPGPFDQTEIEKREDVLVYTTPVLHTAVGVTGMVELKLYVSFKQLQESRRS